MIMQSKMGIWSIFTTAVQQKEVQLQYAPGVLYVVAKVTLFHLTGPHFDKEAYFSVGGGCATVRECAQEGIVSNDGVDNSIRVCEAELCNDEELCNVEDCKCNDSVLTTTTSSAADDFMCYECDVGDSECNGPNETNEERISQTACPTEKCLISGTFMSLANCSSKE